MWVESLVGGGALLAVIGVLWRVQNGRITRVELSKTDKDTCGRVHSDITIKLGQGDTKFELLIKTQQDHGILLARMDERIASWAKQNGVK